MPVYPPPAASGGGGSVTFADEGSAVGTGTILNFVGAGVTTTFSGGTAIATIAGGGGTVPTGFIQGDAYPASPNSLNEEFEGTANTLPANWAWVSAEPGWSLNSDNPSWFHVNRPVSTSTAWHIRRSSFAPGTADIGIWWRMGQVGHGGGYNMLTALYVYNSDDSEGTGIEISGANNWRARNVVASVDSSAGETGASNLATALQGYFGMTRTSADAWIFWASSDGINWIRLGGLTHSFTIARLSFKNSAGDGNLSKLRHSLDWIRVRGDLEWPRP